MKIAVLIDADNACVACLDSNLTNIAEYGEIVLKRVYGDWSKSNLSPWKEKINKFSLKAVQAFVYVKGKNTTDIALIIDAMDLLQSEKVNCFCIVSGDSDFIPLVHRIKEVGLTIICVGREDASVHLKESCDIFITELPANKKRMRVDVPFIGLNSSPQPTKVKEVELFRASKPELAGLKILGKMSLDQKIKKTGTNN